jgi:HNH endonuclease
MGEEFAELDARLEAVLKAAALLGSRLPRVRDPVLARRLARKLHFLLRSVTGGWGALDVAIGEGLAALDVGYRKLDLGYSNIGDYAREKLGINASTAEKMARLAKKLHERPLVLDAVRRGDLTPRKAEVIARVAVGDQQAFWVLEAMGSTVRALQAKVDAPPEADEEKWLRFSAEVSPANRPLLDEGLRVAGIVLGAASTKGQRVNSWSEEYLGSHPAPADQRADDLHFSPEDELAPLKEQLEREHGGWAWLDTVEPLRAPEFSGEIDPWRIDDELRGLVERRDGWDDALGNVAAIFRSSGAWEQLGFANFAQYCEEALGMAERTVAQRVALEHSLRRIPLLRQALREKRITYEKARVIARHAADHEVPACIEKAETMTCIALRRELQDKEEAQMCARGTFRAWVTVSVAETVKAAFRAARAAAKRWLSAEECLVKLAEHYIETWRALLTKARTLQQRVRERDRHYCQVPGCSRAAVHAHHIKPRSQGGTDDPSNLISLCVAHHLRGIHDNRIRVTGSAPDGLVWEFGLRRSYAQTAA